MRSMHLSRTFSLSYIFSSSRLTIAPWLPLLRCTMSTVPGSSTPTPQTSIVKRHTPPTLDAPVKTLFVPNKKKRKDKHTLPEPLSPADVLWHDVRDFLGPEYVSGRLRRRDEWDAPEDLVRGEGMIFRVGAFTVSGESTAAGDGWG